MVRRRSTVRFRNGAPGNGAFSNIRFSRLSDNQVTRLQLTAGPARCPDTRALLVCGKSDSIRRCQTSSHHEQRICPGFGRCPSPCSGECVPPARSHRVGLAEVEATGPFEDVWRRLRGAAVSLWYGNPRSDEPYPDLGANRCPSPIGGSVACSLRWFTRVALEELRRFPGMREGQCHGDGGA